MKESDILFSRGMEMLKSGDYKKAEELFIKAREMVKKN